MYKVMIVEDEKEIREGLKHLLEEVIGGFKVIGDAANGADALNSLESMKPDVLITDIRMDHMDGLEMIRRIRDLDRTLPIIILSGHSDFEYAKRAIHYGVSDYLLKPVDRTDMMLCLDRLRKQWSPAAVNEPTDAGHRKVIQEAMTIIQENLHQVLSLQYVAQRIHLNHQYLSALFKSEVGINFSEYVMICRMNKAKELLKTTNLKIYEIAGLSGYASTTHFTNIFKQAVGMTPSEYRDR